MRTSTMQQTPKELSPQQAEVISSIPHTEDSDRQQLQIDKKLMEMVQSSEKKLTPPFEEEVIHNDTQAIT